MINPCNIDFLREIIHQGDISVFFSGGSSSRVIKDLITQDLEYIRNLCLIDDRLSSKETNENYYAEYLDLPEYFSLNNNSLVNLESFLDLNLVNSTSKSMLLLGFGEDGHYASIFKEKGIEIKQSAEYFRILKRSHESFDRITLTEKMFNHFDYVLLIYNSESKRKIIDKINTGNPDKNLLIAEGISRMKIIGYYGSY